MTSARAVRWLPSATIAVTTTIMIWWTWGTWPDAVVDFGGEAYAAWSLLDGKLLYRDLAWVSGPLSPYLNATLFRFFGVGIRTLVFSNLLFVAVLVALIWKLMAFVGSRFAATIAALVFVTLFAFSQFAEIGNYNFVTPYAYGLTHGVILSFIAIACFSSFLHSRRLGTIAGAGFAVGLSLLTKAEASLAIGMALFLGFGAALWTGMIPAGRRMRTTASFVGALLVPLAASTLLFWRQERLANAVPDAFGAWRFVFTGSISSSEFYRRLSGLDDPAGSLRALAGPAAAYIVVFGVAAAAAIRLKRTSGRESFVVVLAIALVAFSWSTRVVSWDRAAQPLSLIMLLLLPIVGCQVLRRPRESTAARQSVIRFTIVVFAFVMLWKLALNPVFYHYGFALAMPATLVLVVVLLDWIPSALARRGGAPTVFQAVSLAAVTTLVAAHLMTMSRLLQQKTTVVGVGPDRFIADSRGRDVREALQDIAGRIRPTETLVVLPEGVMLNYLSRRSNPARFITFIPPILAFIRRIERAGCS